MECPFCHGSNSDESRFCNACGQRISTAATGNAAATAGNVAEKSPPGEHSPLGKLYSPLLSGGYKDEDLEDQDEDTPVFSPPRHIDRLSPSLLRHPNTNLPSSLNPTSDIGNKAGRLRSPLLESAKPEPTAIPEVAPRKEEYEALRSPFLSTPFPITSTPVGTTRVGTTRVDTTPAGTTTPLDTTAGASSSYARTASAVPPPAVPPAHKPATPVLQKSYESINQKSPAFIPSESASPKPYAVLTLLTIATVLKIWFINHYWGQMVVVIDQIAQLLVIVSVAGLCLGSGEGRSR